MNSVELSGVMQGVATVMREQIASATTPLLDRMTQLEKQAAETDVDRLFQALTKSLLA